MGFSSPDIESPAKRPERVVETEAEDIVLGTVEDQPGDMKTKGKRALTKPSGSTSATGTDTSGLNV